MPILDHCISITAASTGDLIYTRPLCRAADDSLEKVRQVVASTDIAFGNFEASIVELPEFRGFPQAQSGGSWLMAAPAVAGDLRKFGFSLLSHANNHAMDWGVEGLLNTSTALRKAGLIVAGSGPTLSSARQPQYFDAKRGRIGIVATASSFTPMSRAADPVGQVPGRPGINPLRVQRIGVISPENLAVFARIYNARRHRDHVKDWDSGFNFMGIDYLPSDKVGEGMAFTFKLNETDATANISALKQAKLNSDFVVFSIHNHQPGFSSKSPPNFLKEIARRAIDVGTDLVAIHGSHEIGPIEIYKRRPIFYSLGNFVFDGHAMDAFPADMYELLGLEVTSPVSTVIEKHDEIFFRNPLDYKSILPISSFDSNGVTGIKIFPIDLEGSNEAPKGSPTFASGETARDILVQIRELSQAFGTNIVLEDGVGKVLL